MRYLQHADTSAKLTRIGAAFRGDGVFSSRTRSGISLLEVVFSIGVVMIGLVGIAALLPVAGMQARQGAVADAAARLGADAVREFHVRGMANPSTWRWFDLNVNDFRTVTVPQRVAGNSFCIDPRFVAQGTVNSDYLGRNGFPYIDDLYVGTILSMPRVTLSRSPLEAENTFMGKLQADQVFTSDDDLVFELDPDRTVGPRQVFSPPAPSAPLKRSLSGHTSWMATVVPRLDRMGNLTDEYTLSVVVFSRRVIDAAVNNADVASERVADVRSFFSGQPAIGGGDLELATRRNNAEDLQLRKGDWVMLSSYKSTSTGNVQVHNWYRVANAGEEPVFDAGNSNWVSDVTLIGPDWDWGHMANNTPTQYLTRTQVTIARGVVAVFEKTIRLETSSLWTY